MTIPVTFRTATLKDVPALAEVHVASWRVAYKGLFPDSLIHNLSVEDFSKRWRETFAEGIWRVELAVSGDRVVGFTCLTPTLDAEEDPTVVGEVLALYIHPDYWEAGIGTSLVNHSFQTLRSLGFTRVVIWCLKGNERAQRFYSSRLRMTLDQEREREIRGLVKTEVRYSQSL